MKAKTEELLYLLLWTCDMLTRPTFRNLTDSFESWCYRNGLHLQLARLEHQKFIERQGTRRRERHYRLTETGRMRSLGGRDPEACWGRHWDGRWRVVLFDFPVARNAARNRLRSELQRRGFGYLQKSVWITPDPVTEQHELLAGGLNEVDSLILLEGRPCAGETDEEIVAAAWDFAYINRRYEQCLRILGKHPREPLHGERAAAGFERWIRKERLAWQEAIAVDPLLPERLLPSDYLGRRAWRARQGTLSEASAQMRAFKP